MPPSARLEMAAVGLDSVGRFAHGRTGNVQVHRQQARRAHEQVVGEHGLHAADALAGAADERGTDQRVAFLPSHAVDPEPPLVVIGSRV